MRWATGNVLPAGKIRGVNTANNGDYKTITIANAPTGVFQVSLSLHADIYILRSTFFSQLRPVFMTPGSAVTRRTWRVSAARAERFISVKYGPNYGL